MNTVIAEEKIRSVLVLGDVTDAKDNHSAALTNRVVRAINDIKCDEVIILAGNHDRLKRGQEFFRFLNFLPHVTFVTEPQEDADKDTLVYYLPHSLNPADEWKNLDFSHYRYLFMHQTVTGAVASNGQKMEGERLPPLNASVVISGDIHVPQVIGGVEYVGSPYHVHFGDDFKPRCILIERNHQRVDLHYQSPRRVAITATSIRDLERNSLKAGDYLKLRFELEPRDKHHWLKIKRDAVDLVKRLGVHLEGLEVRVKASRRRLLDGTEATPSGGDKTPQNAILDWADREGLPPEAVELGLDIEGAR